MFFTIMIFCSVTIDLFSLDLLFSVDNGVIILTFYYFSRLTVFEILGMRLNQLLLITQIPLILPLSLIDLSHFNMTWASVSFAQKWLVEMSVKRVTFYWVHFRACTHYCQKLNKYIDLYQFYFVLLVSEGRKGKAGEVSRFTPMMSYHFISELQTSVYMAHLFFVALNFHWCKLVQVVLCKCTAERERNSYYMHSKLWMKVSIYMIYADTVRKKECRLECCIFLSKRKSKTAVTKPDLQSTGVLFFYAVPDWGAWLSSM